MVQARVILVKVVNYNCTIAEASSSIPSANRVPVWQEKACSRKQGSYEGSRSFAMSLAWKRCYNMQRLDFLNGLEARFHHGPAYEMSISPFAL
jgi:hypothetical protein